MAVRRRLAYTVYTHGHKFLYDMCFRLAEKQRSAKSICYPAGIQFHLAPGIFCSRSFSSRIRAAVRSLDNRIGDDKQVLRHKTSCGVSADTVSALAYFCRIS